MARHHERYGSEDHGVGDIARRHAAEDYAERFGTGGRNRDWHGNWRGSSMPEDFGTAGVPEPFDRGYRDEQANGYDERYGEEESRRPSGRRGGYRGRGPKNYARSDERIQEDICERLWEADDVDASDVTVEVQGGVVTLSGNVDQRRAKHRIEDVADDCGGVTDIRNEVHVQSRRAPPPGVDVAPDST